MKKFQMKVFVFLLVVVFFAASGPAFAALPVLKAPPGPNEAYQEEVDIESLQYLKDWGCDITSAGGGYINVTGFTQAYQNVDYIMLSLYLQRWDGSKWVDLNGWTFDNHNAAKAEGKKALKVAKGYYYRVRATHSLTHGGVTEPQTPAKSYSASIYIN